MATKYSNAQHKDVSFKKLAETSPAAITEVNEHGSIIYANSRAEEVLGLEKSEITNRTYDDVAWKITDSEGNDFPADNLPFQTVKRTEEPVYEVRHAIEWPDGTQKLLSVNASPLFDEDSEFDGMVAVIEDITEQFRNQRRLKESKKRYKQLFTETNEGGALHELIYDDEGNSVDYRILEVNPNFESIIGLAKEEVQGKKASEIYDQKKPPYLDRYAEVANTGEPTSFETYYEPLGKHFKISAFSPEKDKFATVFTDITNLKNAKEELEESEQRYRRLFETAQDGMLILNADTGEIIDANPYIRDLLGFSKEELVDKQLWQIGTFQNVVENKEKFEKLVKEGYVRYEHLPLETKGGKEAPVEFVSNTYMVNSQKIVQCNIRDIAKRRKTERELKENERKYRSLFDSIRDAILVADIDRNIIDCNPAFTDLFGYELEEIKGKKTEYIYHDEEEYEEMGQEMEESIGDPNFFYTIHYEKKNGGVFPGETNVFYLKENGGDIVGYIGLIRDVTEELERQRELEQSEKHYRAVFETTGTAMLIIEEDTTISLVNKEVEDLTGYSEEEIEGTSWTELVAREDELERMKKYHSHRRVDPNDAPKQYEFKLVDKAGNEKDVFMTIDIIPGTQKSVASLIDITDRKNYEQSLQQSFIELAETTSRVLGVRDPYTKEHEQRVAELAREVGKRMGLDEDTLTGLYLGGVLHDVGKIAIPETILTNPGELKDVEWQMIKSHPRVGYDQILAETDFPWPVAEMTLHHHERLDGSGYPDGLTGEELSLEVRILATVDVVEAMSTRRPYREARSKERTLKVIIDGKGDKFDPEVVDILVEMIEEGEIEFGVTTS